MPIISNLDPNMVTSIHKGVVVIDVVFRIRVFCFTWRGGYTVERRL